MSLALEHIRFPRWWYPIRPVLDDVVEKVEAMGILQISAGPQKSIDSYSEGKIGFKFVDHNGNYGRMRSILSPF